MGYYERDQATGARTRIITAKEADWGVLNPSPNWKALNVVGGEGLDQNLAMYASNVIRSDRMRNKTVRGTQRPGGGIPFELAPTGQSQLFWHLLGGTVVTTALGGSLYRHVITGATSLPQGFTAEKGFLDLGTPQYIALMGCRVGGVSLQFNVDQMVSGNFDVLARQMKASSATSLCSPLVTPTDLAADPFTSVQATIYEGSSLVPLATASSLSLTINNSFRDTNFVLGSLYRANLKPGSRMTRGGGTFLFDDVTLYNKAIDGTDTAIQIVVSNGTHSFTFDIPNVDFLPNASTPKITDDGPLQITADWEAAKDAGIGSDVKLTIVSSEATIDT